MKIKIVSKIIESTLGTFVNEDTPRADMYYPIKALAMSIAAILGGIAAIVYYVLLGEIYALIMGPLLVITGIGIFLCWKNQSITIIDEENFEYKTMFGKKKIIAFNEITNIKQTTKTLTLYAGTTKISVDSWVIMTPKLIEKINAALSAN